MTRDIVTARSVSRRQGVLIPALLESAGVKVRFKENVL